MMYVFCKNNQNFRIWFMKRDFYVRAKRAKKAIGYKL